MWDLGNENSNCVIPPTRSSAREWLERIASAIRTPTTTALVTVGLHMEDLEEDRRLGPHEASEACDFLTMHGYPIYAAGPTAPPTSTCCPSWPMTRWLGGGRDVLFSEFGLPTYRRGDPDGEQARGQSPPRSSKNRLQRPTRRASRVSRDAGCAGAMLWCYTDYDPAIWEKPPLDLRP